MIYKGSNDMMDVNDIAHTLISLDKSMQIPVAQGSFSCNTPTKRHKIFMP